MIAAATPDDSLEPYDVIMAVTPEMAFRWLEGNTHNRPINQAHVNLLARDMKAGRWLLTHQGIAFDTNGLLIDGQHRLCAVIEANVTLKMRVFFNQPPESRQVLDSGRQRKNLDILTLTGHPTAGPALRRTRSTRRLARVARTERRRRESQAEEKAPERGVCGRRGGGVATTSPPSGRSVPR